MLPSAVKGLRLYPSSCVLMATLWQAPSQTNQTRPSEGSRPKLLTLRVFFAPSELSVAIVPILGAQSIFHAILSFSRRCGAGVP